MRTERGRSPQKGALGEERAASFLRSQGWDVLARNFRARTGEIDLIVRRASQVAFVEVKSWDAVPQEDLGRSIDSRKQRRIARTARVFLSRHPELAGWPARFDVVFLGGEEGGIHHMAGAFTAEGID